MVGDEPPAASHSPPPFPAVSRCLQNNKLKFMQLFACQKVAAWIERQLGVFTSGEYGNTLDDTQNIMDDFEEYKLVLEVQKAVRLPPPLALTVH